VEVTPRIFSDKIATMEALQKKLSEAMRQVLQTRVQLTLVAPSTIQRSEGKAKRVIDRRKI
jgi:phenylacetate-CoA ligase